MTKYKCKCLFLTWKHIECIYSLQCDTLKSNVWSVKYSHGRWYQLSDEKINQFFSFQSDWHQFCEDSLIMFPRRQKCDVSGQRWSVLMSDAGTWRCRWRLAVHHESAFQQEDAEMIHSRVRFGINETYARAACSDANSRHESSAPASQKSCLSYSRHWTSRCRAHTVTIAQPHSRLTNVAWCGTDCIHKLFITMNSIVFFYMVGEHRFTSLVF